MAKLLSSDELTNELSQRNEIIMNEDVARFQEKFRMSYGKWIEYSFEENSYTYIMIILDTDIIHSS